MAIEDELLSEIQSTLGSAITPSLRRSDPSGIFEGYILSLVLRAAVRMGARNPIQYEDVYGNTPTVFEFRTSPGYIASRARPYTHAIIEFPNKPVLEAHIGVLVEGESGVLHECDVAVITREEAIRCRRESRLAWSGSPAIWVSPSTARIVLSVECKFYRRANLNVDLARSFLGLTSDMSSKCVKYFVASTSSHSVDVLTLTRFWGVEEEKYGKLNKRRVQCANLNQPIRKNSRKKRYSYLKQVEILKHK